MKYSQRIVYSLCALLLCACQWQDKPQIKGQFETYLTRIASVQNVHSLPSPKTMAVTLPEKRQTHQLIPSVSIGLLDSYQFRQCELFHLIAERNSILGKVQDEFRNLDYQLLILHGLHQCQTNPTITDEFRQKIQKLIAFKQRHITQHWHNFLYTSESMRHQMTTQQWYQSNRDYGKTPAALVQLNHIHQWIDNSQWQRTPAMIAPYQETLDKRPLIGDLMFSMLNATQWLNIITEQLTHNDAQIWCGPNTNRTRLQHLRNVFQRFFIGDIQPYLASVDGAYLEIEKPLTLFAPLKKPHPVTAQVYRLPIDTIHRNFRQAITRHIAYWQKLFKRCSVNVGNR